MSTIPTNEMLVDALKVLRVSHPSLGRAKVIEKLHAEKGWQISDKRMKACMSIHNLAAIDPKDVEEAKKKAEKEKLPHLPPNPLLEQLSYSKRHKGRIIIYGCGDYDYSVSPVSDMCFITLVRCHSAFSILARVAGWMGQWLMVSTGKSDSHRRLPQDLQEQEDGASSSGISRSPGILQIRLAGIQSRRSTH